MDRRNSTLGDGRVRKVQRKLPKLTEEQILEFKEAFKLFDTDDSGKVCRSTCARGRDEARGSRAERRAEGRRRPVRHRLAGGGCSAEGPSRRAPPTSDPTSPWRDRSMRTS